MFYQVYMFNHLRRKIFYLYLNCHIFTFKCKETKCNGLHYIELSKKRYKEVTSPMSEYQGQLNDVRFTMKIQ